MSIPRGKENKHLAVISQTNSQVDNLLRTQIQPQTEKLQKAQ